MDPKLSYRCMEIGNREEASRPASYTTSDETVGQGPIRRAGIEYETWCLRLGSGGYSCCTSIGPGTESSTLTSSSSISYVSQSQANSACCLFQNSKNSVAQIDINTANTTVALLSNTYVT